MTDFRDSVLDWLSANVELFGMPAQNWMLIVGAARLI